MADVETSETQSPSDGEAGPAETPSWHVKTVIVAVPTVAVGFFLLAWLVIGQPLTDAIGQALGAALGLLVALSVVGAAINARASRSTHDTDAQDRE